LYAASAYEFYHQWQRDDGRHEDWAALTTAFVVSTITAFIAAKLLLDFKTHCYTAFAVYRVLPGAALLGG